MKKISILLISLVISIAAYCGDVTKGATYLKDTTIKATNYKLYLGAKGGRFIVVTSKTGTQYRKYFSHK